MTTLTSRKTVRAQLKTVLKTGVETIFDIDGWSLAAYESEPKDFGGQSPALWVHSDGSMTVLVDYARELHRFWVTWVWKRDDPDTTEDALDDLSQAVRQTLYDHAEEPGYWSDLLFEDEFTEVVYLLLDGVQYRAERLRVTVLSVCDNS